MQAEIYAWLRENWKTQRFSEAGAAEGELVWTRSWLQAERLYAGKFGICFADIALQFRKPSYEKKRSDGVRYTEPGGDTIDVILEIKPKIYSIGAVLRQCEIIEHRLRAMRDSRAMHMVHSVVRPTDPLAKALATLSRFLVFAFDGENFVRIRGD